MTDPASELNLVEIFWSVQGEGVLLGEPCVFVRLGQCDLRCSWCDSPETWQRADRCRIEIAAGSERFEDVENPVKVSEACRAASLLTQGAQDLVSITGGEPLLQPEGVRALAEALRAKGARILLETHGLAVEALPRVADVVDVISMDWKLASSVRRASDRRGASVAPFHELHERFLCSARTHAEVYVKVVVTTTTEQEELDEVCRRVARCAPETTLILQPVTPHGPVRDSPGSARLLEWVRSCREHLDDVRLIPQTHKDLGVL